MRNSIQFLGSGEKLIVDSSAATALHIENQSGVVEILDNAAIAVVDVIDRVPVTVEIVERNYTIEIQDSSPIIEITHIGIQGAQGIQGIQGEQGIQGATGATGATGANGQGVPAGGTAGQVLEKIDGTDFNTHWVDPSAGISTDSGWGITGAYSSRKTFDPTNYTQKQLVELVCTLIDLLKTQTLPHS